MSVEELRTAIEQGDYEVDPEAVAQAILDRTLAVLPPAEPLAPEYQQPFSRLGAA